jgi:hypothetical protein
MRSLLFPLLALFQVIALAQEVPNAAQVAGAIGREIEFQDEIKAISYSRSTEGYYFSFGAPYPAQVLSVWVSRELYDYLPASHKLVGRLVRIKGELEKSPSGPLVKLKSRDQFTLMQADEAVLSEPLLDGKQDRDQFMAAVWQTFRRSEFDKLETLAEELRQSRERFSDGLWMSDAFFSAFAVGEKTSSERFASVEQLIAKWEAARPGSIVTPIVKAGFHKDLAWKSRGNDSARTVKPEGWKGFKRELAIARSILEKNPGARIHPAYFAVMQSIALGQGWSKEEFMRLFAEATAVERDYYAFYFNTAHFLLPQWHGRKGEWEQFAEEQRQARGAGGEGDALYARIAWALQPYYPHMFRETAISWDVMASGLEYLVRQYPESRFTKNAYAYFAWKAGDRARLRKALPEIKAAPDMNIWVNLENVALAEKFAASNTLR